MKSNKTSILNYVLRLSLLLITPSVLLSSHEASGQTFSAKEYHFTSCKGQSVITRENHVGVPIIAYRSSTTVGAGFTYGNWGGGTARYFVILDSMTLQNNQISYTVNDMQVIGKTCFFCGVRSVMSIVNNVTVIDSIGFIGRLYLNDWDCTYPADSIKHKLQLIKGTKSLERMAVEASGSDTILAMTGIADINNSNSCLVVAKRTYLSTSWKYDIRMTPDENETFTDIAIDAKNIVIASRRYGSLEAYKFYLRSANKYSVTFLDDYSDFASQNSFNIYSVSLECSTQGVNATLDHDLDVQIRICAIPWESAVHVAYECHSSSSLLLNNYSTALGRVETGLSPMTMDNIQVTAGLYARPGTFVDMKYIYNTPSIETTNAIGLVHITEESAMTHIEYPYGLLSDYGGSYIAFRQTANTHLYNSMSVFNGNDIRLAGRFNPATLNLIHLNSERQYIESNKRCLENKKINICTTNETLNAIIFNSALIPHPSYSLVEFDWGAMKSAQLFTTTGEITCFKIK